MVKLELSAEDLRKMDNISTRGSASASEALSIMTDQELSVEISNTDIIDIEQIQKNIEANGIVTAVYLKIKGDLIGEIIFMFPESSGLSLVDMLFKRDPGTTLILDDMGESALKEVGNILAGNYLAALSNYLSINLLESVPDIASDMEESILNSIALELSQHTDETLVFEMKFNVSDDTTNGKMLIFLEDNSIQTLQKLLKDKQCQTKSMM